MNSNVYSRRLIEEMNQYYEAQATWHDEYMGYKTLEGMEELLKPIVETVARIIDGKNVIEVACGTGNWTQVLGKRARFVTAIDISPTALAIARRKLLDFGNVSLIQCSAYELPKMQGLFDVLFAADWWSHIPMGALPLFLGSISSQLKTGSKAVFLDMSLRQHFKQERSFCDSDNNRISRRNIPDGSEFKVVKNFPSEMELRRILAPFSKRVEYFEFDSLQRWMVVFEIG